MAEAITKATGRQVELKTGRAASFEVTVGDDVVFSKLETERFPTTEEVLDELK